MKIILSKKIIGYSELKSIMNDNYKIDTIIKKNSIPGMKQISKLALKKNDKEVLEPNIISRRKFFN